VTLSNSSHDPIGDSGAATSRERIESTLRRAIGASAGSDDLVDFSVIALPGGWVRIAIEDTARARPDALDFLLLFDSAKRELARVGLAVAGEIVAAHGCRILARPAMRS
jgi:hypothetical protein